MKLVRQAWIVVLVALAFACSEDDPLPRATVNFSNDIAEVGRPVMFDNLTTNADRYEWRFGNSQTSEEISPTITFSSPGSVQVTLKAFTKDGQVDSVSKTVNILQRYLVSYAVKSFPSDSLGFDWDKDEVADEDKLPDVLVLFIADEEFTEETVANSVFGPVFLNAKGQDIGNVVDNDVILTDQDWYLELSDWDGTNPDAISFANDPFSVIVAASFNPVQIPSKKDSDGLGGSFSITGFDSEDHFVDIEFFYELR